MNRPRVYGCDGIAIVFQNQRLSPRTVAAALVHNACDCTGLHVLVQKEQRVCNPPMMISVCVVSRRTLQTKRPPLDQWR